MKKLAIAASVLALAVTVAFAGVEEDREKLMKTFGKSMGELAPVAKGEKPFDAAAVLASLQAFNENAQKLDVVTLFPKDSKGEAASPKIWENFADFQAHADKFKADVAAAVAAPPQDVAGLGATLGTIGKNCGGCHEVYRLKKE